MLVRKSLHPLLQHLWWANLDCVKVNPIGCELHELALRLYCILSPKKNCYQDIEEGHGGAKIVRDRAVDAHAVFGREIDTLESVEHLLELFTARLFLGCKFSWTFEVSGCR